MKRVHMFIGVSVTSAALVATIASPAFAWHPVGRITKQVQNVTQSSQLAEANTAAEAISAKPGDTLKYVITVRNDGKYDKRGWNDMHYTKVVDQLPTGVELVTGPTNKDLGHIAAGAEKKYEFTVKVTAQRDKTVVCNTASFTGDSEVKDQPQKGSDTACVKVSNPPVPVTPTTPVTPEQPKTPETPKTETPAKTPVTPVELPKTGAAETLLGMLGLSISAGLGVSLLRRN